MFAPGFRSRKLGKRTSRPARIPLLVGSTLEEASREAATSGIRLVVFGDGEYVVRQDPMPEIWANDRAITVWLDGFPEIPSPRR